MVLSDVCSVCCCGFHVVLSGVVVPMVVLSVVVLSIVGYFCYCCAFCCGDSVVAFYSWIYVVVLFGCGGFGCCSVCCCTF